MSEERARVGAEAVPGAWVYGMYLGALAVCLVGNLVARGGWLPPGGQVAVGLLAASPLVLAAVLFWRGLRRNMDELIQRVALEGLALAFTVYLPLAGLYVNLRAGGVSWPQLDSPELLMVPALLVVLGIALAWRRYR